MPKVPDNEMEHFFRESANNDYDIAFNPEAWEKMEQKLDRRDRKVFWWRWGTLLSVLLVALVSVFFILTPLFHQNEELKDGQLTKKQQIGKEKTDLTTNTETNKHDNREDKTAPIEDQQASKHKLNDYETDKNTNPTIHRNSNSDDLGSTDKTKEALANGQSKNGNGTDKNTTTKSDEIGGNKGTYQKGKGLKGDVPIVIGKDDDDKEKSKVYTDDKKVDEGNTIDSNAITIKQVNPLLTTQLSLKALPAQVVTCVDCQDSLGTIPSFPKDTTSTPDKRIKKGLFINLSISPDMSGVGPFIGTDGVRTGMKSGILLEYQPTTKLSFYGGSFFSKKRYVANPEEYHPPAGFWTNDNKPEAIDGSCNVLEIPVGLRYYFLKKERSSVFVGTGLNSYLLLREEYEYNYETNNPNWVQSWVGKNESKHWFGVSSFSVGFEKQLGQQTYFQIEPYIQLPLSDVGFGKVKLYSYGTYLTLKYRLK